MLLCETLPPVIKDGKFYKQWVRQKKGNSCAGKE